MWKWVLASRPKTLVAGMVPVVAGAMLALVLVDACDLRLMSFAMASCLCLQVATNLFNDAIDFEKGADAEGRVGPVRATQSGMLSSRVVLMVASGFLVLATLLALPLFAARGWAIVLIGVPSLYLCFGYTGGPFPLAYLGLGELFVILFFGLVAVAGSALVACGDWLDPWSLLLGFQVGLLSSSLIAINNLRDREGDAKAGKRTLAVRFGERFAVVEIASFLGLPYLLNLVWIGSSGGGPAAWFPWAALPLAAGIACGVQRTRTGARMNRYLALSSLHMVVFAALWVVGMKFAVGLVG